MEDIWQTLPSESPGKWWWNLNRKESLRHCEETRRGTTGGLESSTEVWLKGMNGCESAVGVGPRKLQIDPR